MDLGLKGVHVLVTGASGGIGLETVRLYLELGARVTAHYNTNLSALQGIVQTFGPGDIRVVQADLTNEDDVNRSFSFDSIASGGIDFGPIQVVVINHGIWPTADERIAEMSLDRWKHTIDTNLTSSFLVSREYLKQLSTASSKAQEKASIVFIGSTAGKYGEAGHADYAATKSAMMYGLTLSLKNEIVKIAPKGRVNCIAPGWVKTPMAEEALKDTAFVHRALATTPLKKVAEAKDIAYQIALMSSPTVSGHVNGQVVMVDGGMEGRQLNLPTDFQ